MAVDRPRVFLDIDVDSQPCGRLVIELFADKTPKTCENFRALCTGSHPPLTYASAPFHRIIDEFMVQGGDITKGDGTGGDSIYGGEFDDENLGWREMDASGLVCMANRGKATNSSQFFITLEPCPHLNNKHTIFGQLVAGHDALARMAKVAVDKNDTPLAPVLIARSGELERKKKKPTSSVAALTDPASASDSAADRGRKHRRNASSRSPHSRSRSPGHPPRTDRKTKVRRDSDQVVDETLRGRPRARSDSGSRSKSADKTRSAALSSSRSPARKHMRKRSPSPSRGLGQSREEDSASSVPHRRRRRSLPNQYDDEGRARGQKSNGDRRGGNGGGRNEGYARGAGDRYAGRRDDYSYRPHRESGRDRRVDDGRLGGGGHADSGESETGIKFKGRGSMKYREPNRRW